MPKGRTATYAIWRSCERFNLLPPHVRRSWSDNDVITQAHLIAYSQIRDHEEAGE